MFEFTQSIFINTEKLSAEDRFILFILGYPLRYSIQDINDYIKNNHLDWENIEKLVKRHRIIPYMYNMIKDLAVPESFQIECKENYSLNTEKMLGLTTEMMRMYTLLEEEGISFLSLKGPLFAKMVYGDYNLRQSHDLDILIRQEDLKKADSILINSNYLRIHPDYELSRKQYRVNLKNSHDYSYKHNESKYLIELHWRLFSLKDQFPIHLKDLFKNAVEYNIAGKEIKTLSSPHMILYLLVHGSVHSWFRLFWLLDITKFVQTNPIDWGMVVKEAQSMGIIRSVIQGILLSNLITGLNIPEEIKEIADKDRTVLSLIKLSLRTIFRSEKYSTTSQIARINRPFYLSKLNKKSKYKFNCFFKMTTNVLDWKTVPLPDSLFFLYYLLRPFTWFYNAYLKK